MRVQFDWVEIHRIQPFRDHVGMSLSPFLTLIRGDNGAGKTTILEALAMFGHAPCMRHQDCSSNPGPYIECQISFPTCRQAFQSDEQLSNERKAQYAGALSSLGILQKSGKVVFRIEAFKLRNRDNELYPPLKEDLADESKLRSSWCIYAMKGGAAHSDSARLTEAFKELIRFSRPEILATEEKNRARDLNAAIAKANGTPLDEKDVTDIVQRSQPEYEPYGRAEILRAGGKGTQLPGFISYFNTDMYEWGIGLDIRESPKSLHRDLGVLIKRRLQITIPADNSGFHVLISLAKVQEYWTKVFRTATTGRHRLASVNVAPDGTGYVRTTSENEFLSSGENQVLFLGIVLEVLDSRFSLLLMDEPDLHVSLPTANKILDDLLKRCQRKENHERVGPQCVIVTHLPFYFVKYLANLEKKLGDERYMPFEVKSEEEEIVGLVYLPSDGKPMSGPSALEKIAKDSNAEFLAMQRQLEVRDGRLGLWPALVATTAHAIRLVAAPFQSRPNKRKRSPGFEDE